MNLINLTPVTKDRITEMIKALLPEVGYVRITRHGIVVLKRSRWSFNREILNISDICISLIPRKLAEVVSDHDQRISYSLEFNKNISNLIYMKYYNNSFDIVDYLWRKYTELFIVPMETLSPAIIKLRQANTLNSLLPEIHSLSNRRNLYNVVQNIKASKNPIKSEEQKLLKKISKMKLLPVRINTRWSGKTIIQHIFHTQLLNYRP